MGSNRAATLALSFGALTAAPALRDISTTQQLPAAACNAGTINAHNHIPPVPGNGMNPNLKTKAGVHDFVIGCKAGATDAVRTE